MQSVLSQLSYHVDVELEAEFIILSCLARSLSLSLFTPYLITWDNNRVQLQHGLQEV